jgi:hypothetical protein
LEDEALGVPMKVSTNLKWEMSPPMLNLPYDVWTYIAGFIPNDELWNLRAVNSAFFQAAVTARYRYVELFSWCPFTTLASANGSQVEWAMTMKRWEQLRRVSIPRISHLLMLNDRADKPGQEAVFVRYVFGRGIWTVISYCGILLAYPRYIPRAWPSLCLWSIR